MSMRDFMTRILNTPRVVVEIAPPIVMETTPRVVVEIAPLNRAWRTLRAVTQPRKTILLGH